MAPNSDDLEAQLQQNLRLRRELGAEIAKARESNARPEPASSAHAAEKSAKHDGRALDVPQNQLPELPTAEPRQGTGPQAVFWVLIGAVIAGLALGVTFGWIPISWNVEP